MMVYALIVMMMFFLALAFAPALKRDRANARLETLKGVAVEEQPSVRRRMTGLTQLLRERVGAVIAIFGRISPDGDAYASVRQRLLEGGYRGPNAVAIYMGSRIVAAIGLSLITVIAMTFTVGAPSVLPILVAAMLGYVLPGVIVDRVRSKRQEGIESGLADAIDLMVICVEAGLSLRATLERVSIELEHREPVIAHEFSAAVAEAKAGRGLLRALRKMAERTGNSELDTLVSLMIQTDRFGTPVAETLRMQGDAIRFNRMQRAEEAAQKAPIKMLAPSMLIFLAILIVVGGPAVIQVLGATS